MANYQAAFDYLMRWEDIESNGQPTGAETTDAGGRTRLGIAEVYHPEFTASGFYDTMPLPQALVLAETYYRGGEWAQDKGDSLLSQTLANKLFSLGVNLGMRRVVRWAQADLGLDTDGIVGPVTLTQLNAAPLEAFSAITVAAVAHYQERAMDEAQAGRDYPLVGLVRRAQDSGV